jgi:acetamidase/formamidase
MSTEYAAATSNFEVPRADTVITTAAIPYSMQSENKIVKIDEEHNLDRATAEQLARIIEFLRDIED